ncbi:MAG: MBL fold metallo-hydrolase [Synergistaceae bacterium]|jgi:ribonuclease J|nr:MBL fold metallo-hydrolase [Synergistaceae bacterium]
MYIKIHRGARQIGGCSAEIACGANRVFIDIGSDLPGAETADEPPRIEGLTTGDTKNSALFFTHYHGDHIGRFGEVAEGVDVYMGRTAKAMLLNIARYTDREMLPRYAAIKTFEARDKIHVGGIVVTPLMIDHSAFDAYMFVVEARGKRVLHTGDFRTHGFRGDKTFEMLRRYARDIDYVICEGTMLSRPGEKVLGENELKKRAAELTLEKKYIFVLCSSVNIDRIAAFYQAKPAGRLFICDKYQKEQLETVSLRHAAKSALYDFRYALSYGPNLDERMEKDGFRMLVRRNEWSRRHLEKYFSEPYRKNSILIYSMWRGYLEGSAANRELIEFLKPYDPETLHTSGHATAEDIAELYRAVNPKEGLIPIHTEAPEEFKTLIPDGNIILLRDGETLAI